MIADSLERFLKKKFQKGGQYMETRQNRVWCFEDDQAIRDILVYTLNSCGFEARGFEEAGPFYEAVEEQEHLPDLILLDIMLPHSDGNEILARLRSDSATRKIPVIMTTAKGMESDKIRALEAGADDYLVKPFGMMEMIARIRAVLRRCQSDEEEVLVCGPIEIDQESRKAAVNGQMLELTRKEFDLLAFLAGNAGRVYSRDQLLEIVWKVDAVLETRTVDAHIGSLRAKLQEYGNLIETVRGIGYRMKKES